jgi:glycosyltransferase involved in cell wall biosynthesis
MKKVLFLYTELAAYTLTCLRYLASNHPVEVHVVRYPVNNEAPFEFDFSGIKVYERSDFSRSGLVDLIETLNPSVIVCSGWIDKDYVAVCKLFRRRVPTVLALDNQWEAKFKQRLAMLLSPLLIKPAFSHAWVPGEPQRKYAFKLGFKKERVLTGFYSADTPYFTSLGNRSKEGKQKNFPKRFIYVGRYIEHKGINELWDAYRKLRAEVTTDWELWCLGVGELYDKRPNIEGVTHFGFVQPDEMDKFIKETSVFVLPSHFEPWGVVVHEFAAAGFPLLLSKRVGAANSFLVENDNGYVFNDRNAEDLFICMKKIVTSPTEDLLRMGERSSALAQGISPERWSSSLLSILSGNE